jgi:hypothetical protein
MITHSTLTIDAIIRAFVAYSFASSRSFDPKHLDTNAPAAIEVPIEIEVAKKVRVVAKPMAATKRESPRRLMNHISKRSTKKIDTSPTALVLDITIM